MGSSIQTPYYPVTSCQYPLLLPRSLCKEMGWVLEHWFTHKMNDPCKGDRSERLQEIPQLIIIYEIWLQPTSRRFLRELNEAPGGNNLHYILQCLHVPASVTRVWTRKVCWMATECSWNDGSKTQYYIVILDRLQDRSRGLEQAPESRIRGPLTTLKLMSRSGS